MAMTTMVMTPEQLRAFVHSEIERWSRLAKLANIPKK
jgi:tripartite-type tricarboxylate transporter receptor subunit TctC